MGCRLACLYALPCPHDYPCAVETGVWVDSDSSTFPDKGEVVDYTIVVANEGTVTLSKKDQVIPERITLSDTDIIPFHAGETLGWSVS